MCYLRCRQGGRGHTNLSRAARFSVGPSRLTLFILMGDVSMTLDVNRVKSPGRRLAAALILAVAGLGLAGCGDDTSTSRGNTTHAQAIGIVSGVITDTNGNPLAGATITATVAKGLNGMKAAHDVSVTTVANGHFTIANVPAVNAVNNNGTATGGALTLSVEAPAVGSGYMSATVHVFPQAQVTSTETGGPVSGEGNPQVIWFDNFNADAGTIQLPGFVATITGVLRNATTGAAMGNVPMRATFETVEFDQCPGGHNDTVPGSCSDFPAEAVIVTYASGATYLPDNS